METKNGWLIQFDLFWFSPILKDSKCIWSHDPIVMALNNGLHNLAVVVAWVQGNCLEMKKMSTSTKWITGKNRR